MPEFPMYLYRPLTSILKDRKTRKAQITVRLDEDILKWLRSQGQGYQTKLNAMLRQLMIVHKAGKKAS
jgi:uncharacterized protein (DUF4415 family)